MRGELNRAAHMERYAPLWHTSRNMLRQEVIIGGRKARPCRLGHNRYPLPDSRLGDNFTARRSVRMCVSGQPVEDAAVWYTGLSRTGDYFPKALPAAAKASFPKCSRMFSRMASARMACPLNRPLVSLVTYCFFVSSVLLFFVFLRV